MKKLTLLRANKTKFGGAENYLSRLVDELQRQQIACEVVNSTAPKFLSSWIRAIWFNFQVCLTRKKNTLYFSLERVSCPDVYRAGDGVHKIYMDIEKKSFFNPLHIVYLFLEKRAFQNAKKIIAISNMVKNNIIDAYSIPSEKINVVYNGIELKTYSYETSFQKLSKEFLLERDEKIILFVGSGFERKGVKSFLQILSKLKYTQYKAFVIGKESNMRFYKNLTKKLNLEDKVVFTGPRTDVDDFYVIGDIFLFPTKYEPFGNVILEAMNFSNVVITTKQCGGGEILDDKFLMTSTDDYTIYEKIDFLLENNEELQIVKNENYQKVQSFSIEKNAKETLKVIEEVLEI